MKTFIRTIIITASLSTIATNALAGGCSTTGYQNGDSFFGKTECQGAVLSQLTVSGKATLNQVTVSGATIIRGQTTLSNTRLQDLKVSGQLNASGSQFANMTVAGSVNLRDVVIKGTLTASTDLAVLNGVEVQNILITKSMPDKSQIICLEKASHVKGDIQFESGKGTVYTMGASKIMGKVIGGKVIIGACPNQAEVSAQ